MKIRSGFVSNSSSSSFVIFYRCANESEVDDPDIWIFGDSLCDGVDYFQPTQEMRDYIKEHGIKNASLVHDLYCIEGDKTVVGRDLKNLLPDEPFVIEAVDIDYHYTDNFEDFLERYGTHRNSNY